MAFPRGRHAWLLAVVGLAMANPESSAQSTAPVPVYRWTTLAGRASLGVEDGPVADARFNSPHGLAMDLLGNLYVADTGNHTIRKITPAGIVSTFAGSAGQSGSADGLGATARFNAPQGVGVDAGGNVYVADTGNHTIRKITAAGLVSTLAGQPGKNGAADGAASAALFVTPDQLTVDANGTVYLFSGGLRRISSGQVQTLQIPTHATDLGGGIISVTATGCPAVDLEGNLYFWAANSSGGAYPTRVLKLDRSGNLTAQALGQSRGGSIFSDVFGRVFVVFNLPAPGEGSVFVRSSDGFQLLPSNPAPKFVTFLSRWGSTTIEPRGACVDQTGRWYYTRPADHAIIRDPAVFAGTALADVQVDSRGPNARITDASALTVDSTGNVWIADLLVTPYGGVDGSSSFALRKIDPAGTVSTIAPPSPPNLFRYEISASLAVDGGGNVLFSRFVAEYSRDTQHEFQQVSPSGAMVAIPTRNPPALKAISASSNGVTLGITSSAVYRRDLAGGWIRLAGDPNASGFRDGVGAEARFSSLQAITSDRGGDFYLLDYQLTDQGRHSGEYLIRKLTDGGAVSTVGQKRIGLPLGLATNSQGTFFLTDPERNVVAQIDPQGNETVIGGSAAKAGSVNGTGGAARFVYPTAIAQDTQSNVYLIDEGSTVRKGEFLGYTPGLTTQPQSLTVSAGASVQFTVTATATPAPTYQWYFNGSPFSGATGSTLTFTNARASDAGDYTVVVTNELGSVTSNKATLTVTSAPTPPPTPAPASGGRGGGGAPSGWFFLALLAAAAARKFSQARAVLRSSARVTTPTSSR